MNMPLRREFKEKLIKDGERTTKKYRYIRFYVCNIESKEMYQIYRTSINNKIPFLKSYKKWEYLGTYLY